MSKNPESGNDRYGAQRQALADEVILILQEHCPTIWFLDGGTLLAAYRTGHQIPHDDDFDLAIILADVAQLTKITTVLNKFLTHPRKARMITSYAHKIEVYDPSWGSYHLPENYNGADFHNVTVDLQTYLQEETTVRPLYYLRKSSKHNMEDILPIREIKLEGKLYKAPKETKTFLTKVYGCIEEGAKYDPTTGKYTSP